MRVIPLWVVLGGWLSTPALAADAEQWIARLAAAQMTQSYAGTFIYERDGDFSSHAVWQRVSGDQVRERQLQLDGAALEFVQVDGDIRCASDELGAQVPAGGRMWQSAELDVAALADAYEFRLIGESRVAGRSAIALAVRPRDQHRYGFELHLDRETALPLKSLTLNERGQLLERFQFAQFSAGAVAADDVQAGPECRPVERASPQEQGEPAWRSDWLPPGFRLIDSGARQSPASGASVAWLAYGDGLARFSVFLEPLQGEVVDDARSQMGSTVALAKRITTADGGVMVTVVGEIPAGTAERIALSMRVRAESAQR